MARPFEVSMETRTTLHARLSTMCTSCATLASSSRNVCSNTYRSRLYSSTLRSAQVVDTIRPHTQTYRYAPSLGVPIHMLCPRGPRGRPLCPTSTIEPSTSPNRSLPHHRSLGLPHGGVAEHGVRNYGVSLVSSDGIKVISMFTLPTRMRVSTFR